MEKYISNVTVYLIPDNLMREYYLVKFNHEKKLKFVEENMKHYEMAASWTVDEDGEEAADEAFELTNAPYREDERENLYGDYRSVSTGDIVEVSNKSGVKFYLCESIGWTEIQNFFTSHIDREDV